MGGKETIGNTLNCVFNLTVSRYAKKLPYLGRVG